MLQTAPYPWRDVSRCACKAACITNRYQTGKFLWGKLEGASGVWAPLTTPRVMIDGSGGVGDWCFWGFDLLQLHTDPLIEYSLGYWLMKVPGAGTPFFVRYTAFARVPFVQQWLSIGDFEHEDQYDCREVFDEVMPPTIQTPGPYYPEPNDAGMFVGKWGWENQSPF